jgi:hypothetical protein
MPLRKKHSEKQKGAQKFRQNEALHNFRSLIGKAAVSTKSKPHLAAFVSNLAVEN